MRNNVTSIWTDELRSRVKFLWVDHSAKTIAGILQADGHSITRNGVIGFLHRARMTAKDKSEAYRNRPKAPPRVKKPKNPQAHKPHFRVVAMNGNSRAMRVIQSATAVDAYEPISNEALDLAARHISFDELTNKTCKWPYGNGPFTFCGCAKHPDLPYCIGHQLRSQQVSRHYNLTEEERERRRLQTIANLELHRRKQSRRAAA